MPYVVKYAIAPSDVESSFFLILILINASWMVHCETKKKKKRHRKKRQVVAIVDHVHTYTTPILAKPLEGVVVAVCM